MQDKCQVFTPDNIVNKLLDEASYRNDLFGKKVYENSCGTGNILIGIVKRYIEDCLNSGLTTEQIKEGLESDIYAADIDADCCSKAGERLNLIALKYGIRNVRWNLLNIDTLFDTNVCLEFDYIIGNPPYISYKDIESETRSALKKQFKTCSKGKFDYYYAFFEKAIDQLSDAGRLAYIVPNSCFKNVFASSLRDLIKPLLVKIVDYRNQQLFDVLTSSAIIVLNKEGNNGTYSYNSAEDSSLKTLSTETLEKEKWTFNNNGNKEGSRLFGDDYKVSNSIATLSNKVFIIDSSNVEDLNDSAIRLYDGSQIENTMLRSAYSPKSMRLGKTQYAVFPYRISEDTVDSYDETQLRHDYPLCYRYLKAHKTLLDQRATDGGAKWFEYGRKQGLNTVAKNKLIMSTVVTDSVHVYEVDQDSVVYAGIVITCKTGDTLIRAKTILQSREFLDYIHEIGTNVSGNSLRITAKDVSCYRY